MPRGRLSLAASLLLRADISSDLQRASLWDRHLLRRMSLIVAHRDKRSSGRARVSTRSSMKRPLPVKTTWRTMHDGAGARLRIPLPFRGHVMADALVTDQEIAILCDVAEGWGANLNEDKRKVLDQLIAKGFVVSADQESSAKYKL